MEKVHRQMRMEKKMKEQMVKEELQLKVSHLNTISSWFFQRATIQILTLLHQGLGRLEQVLCYHGKKH